MSKAAWNRMWSATGDSERSFLNFKGYLAGLAIILVKEKA